MFTGNGKRRVDLCRQGRETGDAIVIKYHRVNVVVQFIAVGQRCEVHVRQGSKGQAEAIRKAPKSQQMLTWNPPLDEQVRNVWFGSVVVCFFRRLTGLDGCGRSIRVAGQVIKRLVAVEQHCQQSGGAWEEYRKPNALQKKAEQSPTHQEAGDVWGGRQARFISLSCWQA